MNGDPSSSSSSTQPLLYAQQQQQQLFPVQDNYMNTRVEALQNVESTIHELSNIFTQLATMVSQQGELAIRFSETQTHQIAARKEQQMETMRAALKIGEDKKEKKKQGKNIFHDSEDDSRHSDPESYFNEGDDDKEKKGFEKQGYPNPSKKKRSNDPDSDSDGEGFAREKNGRQLNEVGGLDSRRFDSYSSDEKGKGKKKWQCDRQGN